MPEETIVLPVGFYLALAVTGVGMIYAWTLRMNGIGLPMMAVLGTVAAWYFGDATLLSKRGI